MIRLIESDLQWRGRFHSYMWVGRVGWDGWLSKVVDSLRASSILIIFHEMNLEFNSHACTSARTAVVLCLTLEIVAVEVAREMDWTIGRVTLPMNWHWSSEVQLIDDSARTCLFITIQY